MSSFFTLPASQRKRKRPEGSTAPSSKRRTASSSAGPRQNRPAKARKERDKSISVSEDDSDEDDHARSPNPASEEESDDEETAAERRLRLAEQYLENIREEVDEAGFDAADIDKDLIAERLKEDVAETKGKVFKYIAKELDWEGATHTLFRADQHPITGVATYGDYAYTVGKDMSIVKWEIPTPPPDTVNGSDSSATLNGSTRGSNYTLRRRPKKLLYTRGLHSTSSSKESLKSRKEPPQHHTSQIRCVAASPTGRFLATGDSTGTLIVWDPETLKPLKVFATQHRGAINGLAFRRGTNQLFSASSDRTIKLWSLDELAYIETLFGHQDIVVDVAALADESCVSVGARDRTARLWKVVEESQLVFRGGGSGGSKSKLNKWEPIRQNQENVDEKNLSHDEGSIDRLCILSSDLFVTGSDNGALALWNIHKKKPIHVVPLAHGLDPGITKEEALAEEDLESVEWRPPPRQPRWITALASVPYADVVVSGSWDGWVRVWRVEGGRRLIEVGKVGYQHQLNSIPPAGGEKAKEKTPVRGVITDISIFERGERGRDGVCIVAAVGKEHRLGRWFKMPGKNGGVVFEVRRKAGLGRTSSDPMVNGEVSEGEKDA
ncbi:WD40 repeat-like protein [Patellaria atrata CBS 101060]|uniref:WD40 repeat-like protein n=1 Tax=Patellaria atrata CBS 101060 TaxID=1346257 RepID=A0A9P4VRA9_9PEZI|nr:WD40 repeat-like protein [Patellaria atrata CBS 101060]